MSYDQLPNGESFLDDNQLPALLDHVEGLASYLYDDGAGNLTIGYGLNLFVTGARIDVQTKLLVR